MKFIPSGSILEFSIKNDFDPRPVMEADLKPGGDPSKLVAMEYSQRRTTATLRTKLKLEVGEMVAIDSRRFCVRDVTPPNPPQKVYYTGKLEELRTTDWVPAGPVRVSSCDAGKKPHQWVYSVDTRVCEKCRSREKIRGEFSDDQ